MRRVSRRGALGAISTLSLGAFAVACGGSAQSADDEASTEGVGVEAVAPTATPPPAPTATPVPPFVIAEGEERRLLMAGTPYETPLYVYGSGRPGPIAMALGGVHGNEPGGWMAAERLNATIRPAIGGLLFVPRANKLAINIFERTTDQLGDLNRLYPGDPNGLPMARMAAEIIDTLRAYHVNAMVDMHESWAFYGDRPQNGTAYLGQTVTTFQAEPAITLARNTVAAVNTRIRAPMEQFYYRDSPNRPPDQNQPLPQNPAPLPNQPGNGISSSSLGIPRWVDGISVLLVEMGQQQALERRIALHIDVFTEVLREIGLDLVA